MPDYNFLNLSPIDFEVLTRDVLQKHYNIHLESFTTGRDGGIDLRYSRGGNSKIMVQCKRYENYSSLKSNLKKEYTKVKILNPEKYILSTSVGLTPPNKDEIIKIFNGYIKEPSDIFGKNDLNNLLGQFPEIENSTFKLWIPSTNMLHKLLHNDLINRSDFEKENIPREIKVYVQNKSYSDAVNILNNYNFVLISGIPGIGKTTLAKVLLYNYMSRDFELVVISSDVNEAESLYEKGKKQLFYYDDFLGSNFLEERLKKNEDYRLVRFIEKIKKNPSKKLIMTTREYILNQAKLKYEKIAHSNLEIAKCIIDLEGYSKLIRAEILYNHLFYSKLQREYVHALLINKSYLKIIDHPNYNPRIIQFMTDMDRIKHISEREFFDFFISNLNNPTKIWEHSFTNKISKPSKYLLYSMLVSDDRVFEEDLEKTFWKFYTNESKKLNFKIKREDFINSIKELENTFIKSSKVQIDKIESINKNVQLENLFEFQNPSIRDFLINKIRNNINLISSLIDSSIYLNQLYNIYKICLENKSYKILLDDNMVLRLKNNIIQKYDNLESIIIRKYFKNANKYYWKSEKLSDIKKLYNLASFYNFKECPKIANFIIAKLSKYENEDNLNHSDKELLMDILVIFKEYCDIKCEKLIEKYFSSIENFDDIYNFIKIKNNFPKIFEKLFNDDRNIEEVEEEIIEIINNEYDFVCNEGETDIGAVAELKSNLEEFEENLEIDFDFQDLIIDLENKMTEDPNNYDPPYDMDYEFTRNHSYNSEEKIIENMFDSLDEEK